MQHHSAKVNNTYLHILMLQLFDPLWIPLKGRSIKLFRLNLMSFQDACQCWQRDLMDIIENGMVTDNVGLNFSEPDNIIGQNHVYDLSLLFLHEYGPPSSLSFLTLNPT